MREPGQVEVHCELHRRDTFRLAALGGLLAGPTIHAGADEHARQPHGELTVTDLRVTPIALPDPPILAASGCHGPYFLRNIVEVVTDGGIVGISETRGGVDNTEGLLRSREIVRGMNVLTMSTNMCVTRFEHIPEAVVTQPIDVVLGDHHGWGGIGAFQALGTIAETLDWQLSQHSNNHAGITMAAMLHVGASVPQLTLASDTHYVWLVDDADILVGGKLQIHDGQMSVPQGPGLGVEIDRDQLSRAQEAYVKSGVRSRNDAELMRKIQPGWERTLM